MSCDNLIQVITPELYIEYGTEAREDCPGSLWQSGLVRQTSDLNALAMGNACSFTAGGWSFDGTGDRKNGFDAFAPYDCDACDEPEGKEYKMSMIERQNCWLDRDVLKLCNAFPDPAGHFVELISNWTVDKRETDLMAMLVGLYNSNVAQDGGDLVVDADDAAINQSDVGNYSLCTQVETMNKFGCKSSMLEGVVMHTRQANHLMKTGQLSMVAAGTATTCEASCFEISGMFHGKPVYAIDDDRLIVGGKYLSVCFKPGAFGYGEGMAVTPFERDRDVCADGGKGATKLIARERYLLHPMGFNFDFTAAAGQTTPAPADLAAGANWCRVVNCKNSPLAFTVSTGDL